MTSPDAAPHAWTVDETLGRLSSARGGLTEADARRRLDETGPNALPAAPPRSAWLILLDQLRSVVVLLLCAAAGVAALVGDLTESLAIGAVLVINTALGFVTELRARRAMESLARLQAPHAIVIRDGAARQIDARELVPGDVVQLEAGQVVPADARLLESSDVATVEASLTGESLPVIKSLEALDAGTPLPDRANMLFQGTTVATGTGQAVIVATGVRTELGRIGELAASVAEERTPLERRLDRLGHRLVWLALGTGAVVAGLGALRGLPLGELIETGIALAIAAVPEGLPVIATTALAVGVSRMARRQALIRRLASAETLGSVTVICTDKTGTLTAGAMAVTVLTLNDREITITGAGYDPAGQFLEHDTVLQASEDPHLRDALTIGLLANRASLVTKNGVVSVVGDPTEAALLVAAAKAGLDRDERLRAQPHVGDVPFSSERMLMATFHQVEGDLVAYVKGAPTRVLERCDRYESAAGDVPLDDASRRRFIDQNKDLASRGLRVLALARGRVSQADEGALQHLTFVGFAGLIDPPAEGVKDTIRLFRDAGIRTVMLTGDQQLTAQAVAKDLGIISEGDEVMDGRRLAGLSKDELVGAHVAAFSRVDPAAKLAIVRAFQRRGDIVAVLGDGVNDAPALRQADIGVAMGARGTDVAKEAAGVVLLDDRFSTIGVAVEQGRVIFDNIRKFVFYLFSCNMAEVFVLLVAAIVGLPLPLVPLQILWINIVTDTFPALALAVEPAGRDVMRRKPRDPQEAIFSVAFLRAITWFALLITIVTLAAFWMALEPDGAVSPRARTMAFMTLALAQTFHLGNARSQEDVLSWRQAVANPIALGAVALVVGLQILAVHFAPLAGVLHTEPLTMRDWLVCLALSLVPAVAGQAARWWARPGRAE